MIKENNDDDDEDDDRLVNVFLWQLFPDGLQCSFQLISRLRLWLEFTDFSSMTSQI